MVLKKFNVRYVEHKVKDFEIEAKNPEDAERIFREKMISGEINTKDSKIFGSDIYTTRMFEKHDDTDTSLICPKCGKLLTVDDGYCECDCGIQMFVMNELEEIHVNDDKLMVMMGNSNTCLSGKEGVWYFDEHFRYNPFDHMLLDFAVSRANGDYRWRVIDGSLQITRMIREDSDIDKLKACCRIFKAYYDADGNNIDDKTREELKWMCAADFN